MKNKNPGKDKNAVLVLKNGQVFIGQSIGFNSLAVGEVIFNTSMTGYQEILTDPSYYQQIIVFTAPHIGNTGINFDDIESEKIYCSGIVIHELPVIASNWRSQQNLVEYLKNQKIPAIAGIDTRALTQIIRTEGAQAGVILEIGYQNTKSIEELIPIALAKAKEFGTISGKALAYEVSTTKTYDWNQGKWTLEGFQENHQNLNFKVAVLDFGVKYNILRKLYQHNCNIKVFPAKTPVNNILSFQPNGVLLSNGPGDPEPCSEIIENIKKLLITNIPIFGICLGHQLLAIACGCKTEKMIFGHHGANHPVLDLESKKVLITSQNHGFTIAKDLPKNINITHISLFDQSIQGFEHKHANAFGFQGHPEASPGPQDIDYLFTKFIKMMDKALVI